MSSNYICEFLGKVGKEDSSIKTGFSNSVLIFSMSTFGVALLCALVANIFIWLLYRDIHLNVSRSLKSFDKKFEMSMKMLKRRKFPEEMIGQLSNLAHFDLQEDKDDEANLQSKIDTILPSKA
uniref:Uncharacterized protein n=1 Tax=Ditylenchus dipsaci TaxID=166011 RepID=A0A915DDK6_9BILA